MSSFKNVLKDFPLMEKIVYLDSASVCPPPRQTIEAMLEYYRENPYNYGVGVSRDSVEVKEKVDKVRKRIALFINSSSPDEIVFTKNTTEAINLVAYGLSFKQGDEVIITNIEHQSNIIPWLRLKARGKIRVKIMEADSQGIVQPEEVKKQLTPKVKLVAISHVSNVFGAIQPVEEIGEIVKSHGAIYFVDAAQSAGRIPIDVKKTQCDFMAFCGRKSLMGPQGIGFLYGRRDMMEKLKPLMIGSRAANVVPPKQFRLQPIPHRFEAGVINTSGAIGLGASVEYLQKLGHERIRSRIKSLFLRMLDVLQKTDKIKVYGARNPDDNAGIISWTMDRYNYHDVARKVFETHKVVVASGAQGSVLALTPHGIDGAVRTSVHIFNRPEDLDKLEEALKTLR